MAVTKASASGLTGSKFKDASAGTAKIVDVADTPTIGETSDNGNEISIAFTSSNTGGTPTSFSATASNGAVATANSSPIQFSSNALPPGGSYSFQVRALTATGSSALSNSSSNHTIPSYVLSQTFNSSGTFTVGAGITKMGLVGYGSGSNGGNTSNGAGGAGGGGGAKFITDEITVSAGQTYTVTLGGAGGSSSFGNIVTMNAANISDGGNVSVNAGTVKGTASGGSGGGGAAQGHPGSYSGTAGSAGGNSASITTNTVGIAQTLAGGGGGGGGGDWSYRDDYYSWNKPGGAGGAGGVTGGGAGNSGAGSLGGGGGGARGGNVYSPVNGQPGFSGGGSGSAAQIKVYVKG